jgi:hypothetical protein
MLKAVHRLTVVCCSLHPNKCYETQVDVQVGKGNKAGLVLFYNEKAFAGVVSDGKNFTV